MKKYEKFHGRNAESPHRCFWEGCPHKGEFKAPHKGETERPALWFCLDHIRVYNAQWNFFRDMGIEDVSAFRQADAAWHRPTWPLGAGAGGWSGPNIQYVDHHDILDGAGGHLADKGPLNRPLSKDDIKALVILGLDACARVSDIRKRYRALVKKYHPDAGGGTSKSDHMLREVIKAFNQLQDGLASLG